MATRNRSNYCRIVDTKSYMDESGVYARVEFYQDAKHRSEYKLALLQFQEFGRKVQAALDKLIAYYSIHTDADTTNLDKFTQDADYIFSAMPDIDSSLLQCYSDLKKLGLPDSVKRPVAMDIRICDKSEKMLNISQMYKLFKSLSIANEFIDC